MAIEAHKFGEPLGVMDPAGYGCGYNNLALNLQQKLQQQQQQLEFVSQSQRLPQQNLGIGGVVGTPQPKSSSTPTVNHNTNNGFVMGSHIQKQRHPDIDTYIRLQNQKMSHTLLQQRRQQLGIMMRKIEARALMVINHKDQEIASLNKRALELEEYARKMEAETQAWQRIAAENEALIMSLNATVTHLSEQNQALISQGGPNYNLDDTESCCDNWSPPPPTPPTRRQEVEEVLETDEVAKTGENRATSSSSKPANESNMMMCKVCDQRSSCVLFLNCRHLCSCCECAPFIDACPICHTRCDANARIVARIC